MSDGRGRSDDAAVIRRATESPSKRRRIGSSAVKHKWRNWFSVTIRSDDAERRATVSTRIASTSPMRLFGTPSAQPDKAARAALTASTGSDLPSRWRA